MSPAAVNVTAVSYSRISQHAWCPATLRYSLSGLKEPESPQMRRGNEIHKTLERYMTAAGKAPPKLPRELAHLKATLAPIRKLSPVVEAQYAFDKDWRPVEYFAKTTRWRMKIDLAYAPDADTYRLVDYKSGRIKPEEHGTQLELYALTYLLVTPKPAANLELGVAYVDHEEDIRVLSSYAEPGAKLLRQLRTKWEREGMRVMNDHVMAPTPREFKCSRCFYSAKRGGPCKAAVA